MKRLIPESKLRIFSIICSIILTVIGGSLFTSRSSASMMTTLIVNSTADTIDAAPGDGTCGDASGNCTLRAAVMEANASSGAHTIMVPAGTYTLTLAPFDNEFNFGEGATETSGDIDIQNNDLTIIGAGSAATIIDGGGIDRIFDANNGAGSGVALNLTLEGLTLRNGNAPTTPEGFFEAGGAIQFDGTNFPGPASTLTINNCRIINSTASGLGGGIFATSATVNIDNSDISNNTSTHANGGGMAYDGGFSASQSLLITNSTISNNNAPNATFGNGGGLWVGGGNAKSIKYNSITNNHAGAKGGGVFNGNGNLDLSLNAIVGNSASGDPTSTGLRNGSGTLTVENDWWGCNEGPGFSPCDRASGPVGFGIVHWLTLNHTANPSTIPRNTSTTLQADFFTNNAGSAIAPSDLVALNGRSVTFNNPVLGTISGADAQIMNGKANATFNAGNVGGNGSADATVDHATVTAHITISQESVVTTNPTDQTACEGAPVTFTAAASGSPTPTVQWQVSTGGGPFADIPGATNTMLTFNASAAQNGNQYRAVFTNSGGTATTSAATLTVNTAPTVNAQPVNQTACEGAPVTFTAAADGSPSPTVQWQLSTNGGASFNNIPGANSTTLSFNATAAQNGNQYRAVFTNLCNNATTNAATLTVKQSTTATAPGNQTVCQGATASFSTTANGAGTLSYQWKLDGNDVPGATSSSVAIDTTSVSTGSHAVSVNVTGECGTVTQSATLNVQENTSATNPADQTVCQGANASFSTTASGTGPFHYAWTVDGSAFGGDTATINVPTGSLTTGAHTVAVTVNGTCGSVNKSATLTVNENTTATALANQTVCQGATANFNTTASGTAISYQWKLDGNVVAGATSNSVAINTAPLSAGNHTVDVIVTGTCGTVTRSATLTVNTAPVVTTNPASQTVISGNATFTAAASGSPAPTVQWQVSTNGGASFSNIPGATSTTLTFATNPSQNGNQYRAVFTNECGTATTAAATLTTCTPPTVTLNPVSVANACVGQVISFTASASGTPTPTVQWQVSTNGGASFSNIPGATSNTLNITASVAVRNNQYRAVFTNACSVTSATTSAATLGVDTTAPVIMVNHPTLSLWPPNHKYETFNVSDFVASATDNCNANLLSSVVIASVTSDELEDNPNGGDGNTVNDIVIAANCKSVQLRAERDGDLNGRVYTITFKVTDTAGNVGTATARVLVPHDQGNGGAVDSGVHYTVTGSCP